MGIKIKLRFSLRWWQYDFTHNGKRYRLWIAPKAEMTKRKAMQEGKRLAEKAIAEEQAIPRTKLYTSGRIFRDYDKYLELHKPKTYQKYKYFRSRIEKGFPAHITKEDVANYQEKRSKEVSTTTVNREMEWCCAAYNRAIKKGNATCNPFHGFDRWREKERIRYLDEQELMRLFQNLKGYTKLAALLAILTGFRKQDILTIHANELHFDSVPPMLIKDKIQTTKYAPTVSLPHELVPYLRNIIAKNDKWLFLNERTGRPLTDIKKSWKRALRDAQISDFRFHDLRHCFATYVLMRSNNLRLVQELLGHRDMRMTMRYTHIPNLHKQQAIKELNGYVSNAISLQNDTNLDTLVDKVFVNYFNEITPKNGPQFVSLSSCLSSLRRRLFLTSQ